MSGTWGKQKGLPVSAQYPALASGGFFFAKMSVNGCGLQGGSVEPPLGTGLPWYGVA